MPATAIDRVTFKSIRKQCAPLHSPDGAPHIPVSAARPAKQFATRGPSGNSGQVARHESSPKSGREGKVFLDKKLNLMEESTCGRLVSLISLSVPLGWSRHAKNSVPGWNMET